MKDYTFLTRAEYFQALATAARQASHGQRVLVAAMDIDPFEPAVIDLVESLRAAARNGANVHLVVDAHNFLQADNLLPGPLFYKHSFSTLRGKFNATLQLLRELEADGGSFHITNTPKRRLNPSPIGRSHIKGAVVDDQVFIGGCNLEHPGYIDIMVAWHDKHAADVLEGWFRKMVQARRVRDGFGDVDTVARIDDTAELLLDAGVPGQSLIYDTALRLIDDAKEWIYITCQYFPGGPTAKHLAAAAKRGVEVEIVYSHPRSHGTAAPLHQLHQLSQHTRRLPRSFFSGKLDKRIAKLHAKVLANEHEALVGSHNYVIQGILFGTAEVALHSGDPAFALALCTFMKGQITQATHPATQQDIKNRAEISHL